MKKWLLGLFQTRARGPKEESNETLKVKVPNEKDGEIEIEIECSDATTGREAVRRCLKKRKIEVQGNKDEYLGLEVEDGTRNKWVNPTTPIGQWKHKQPLRLGVVHFEPRALAESDNGMRQLCLEHMTARLKSGRAHWPEAKRVEMAAMRLHATSTSGPDNSEDAIDIDIEHPTEPAGDRKEAIRDEVKDWLEKYRESMPQGQAVNMLLSEARNCLDFSEDFSAMDPSGYSVRLQLAPNTFNIFGCSDTHTNTRSLLWPNVLKVQTTGKKVKIHVICYSSPLWYEMETKEEAEYCRCQAERWRRMYPRIESEIQALRETEVRPLRRTRPNQKGTSSVTHPKAWGQERPDQRVLPTRKSQQVSPLRPNDRLPMGAKNSSHTRASNQQTLRQGPRPYSGVENSASMRKREDLSLRSTATKPSQTRKSEDDTKQVRRLSPDVSGKMTTSPDPMQLQQGRSGQEDKFRQRLSQDAKLNGKAEASPVETEKLPGKKGKLRLPSVSTGEPHIQGERKPPQVTAPVCDGHGKETRFDDREVTTTLTGSQDSGESKDSEPVEIGLGTSRTDSSKQGIKTNSQDPLKRPDTRQFPAPSGDCTLLTDQQRDNHDLHRSQQISKSANETSRPAQPEAKEGTNMEGEQEPPSSDTTPQEWRSPSVLIPRGRRPEEKFSGRLLGTDGQGHLQMRELETATGGDMIKYPKEPTVMSANTGQEDKLYQDGLARRQVSAWEPEEALFVDESPNRDGYCIPRIPKDKIFIRPSDVELEEKSVVETKNNHLRSFIKSQPVLEKDSTDSLDTPASTLVNSFDFSEAVLPKAQPTLDKVEWPSKHDQDKDGAGKGSIISDMGGSENRIRFYLTTPTQSAAVGDHQYGVKKQAQSANAAPMNGTTPADEAALLSRTITRKSVEGTGDHNRPGVEVDNYGARADAVSFRDDDDTISPKKGAEDKAVGAKALQMHEDATVQDNVFTSFLQNYVDILKKCRQKREPFDAASRSRGGFSSEDIKAKLYQDELLLDGESGYGSVLQLALKSSDRAALDVHRFHQNTVLKVCQQTFAAIFVAIGFPLQDGNFAGRGLSLSFRKGISDCCTNFSIVINMTDQIEFHEMYDELAVKVAEEHFLKEKRESPQLAALQKLCTDFLKAVMSEPSHVSLPNPSYARTMFQAFVQMFLEQSRDYQHTFLFSVLQFLQRMSAEKSEHKQKELM